MCLTRPLADELTDGMLDERLFAASGAKPGALRPEPNWAALTREMKWPRSTDDAVVGGIWRRPPGSYADRPSRGNRGGISHHNSRLKAQTAT